MDNAHMVAAARYIERHLVRAKPSPCAWQYPWSSAAAHVVGEDDAPAKVEPLLQWAKYKHGTWYRFCSLREYLHMPDDEAGVETLRRHERTGRPLGSERFVKRMEQQAGRQLRPWKPGPKPKEGKG